MDVDLPDVVAEVRAALQRYEAALTSNDVATLDALFRDDPRTVRYGAVKTSMATLRLRHFARHARRLGLA